MSAPLIPYAGRLAFGDMIANSIANGGLNSQVAIFINDIFPSRLSALGDFNPCLAAGLTRKPLPAVTPLGVDPSGRAQYQFATLNYTAGGPGLPVVGYGYYVSFDDPITGLPALAWCQRWDVPFAWINPGDNYPLNLSLGDSQC